MPKLDDTDEVVIPKGKGLNLKAEAGLVNWLKLAVAAILFLAIVYGAVQYGKHTERKVTYFSELLERTSGRKQYFMDFEVVCSNGKDLGRIQVDLNLTNGKIKIVRNDNQLEPNCSLPALGK